MLATLSEPTSGTARVCGYDVVRDADKVRSVLSLTGQFAALEDISPPRRTAAHGATSRVLEGFEPTNRRGLIDRFDIGEFARN